MDCASSTLLSFEATEQDQTAFEGAIAPCYTNTAFTDALRTPWKYWCLRLARSCSTVRPRVAQEILTIPKAASEVAKCSFYDSAFEAGSRLRAE